MFCESSLLSSEPPKICFLDLIAPCSHPELVEKSPAKFLPCILLPGARSFLCFCFSSNFSELTVKCCNLLLQASMNEYFCSSRELLFFCTSIYYF
ncbi:unnamed protein product [Moneuplotes crassus]|uniref:Uncharacterized protein n=1 Tax=Euplotes crassus TaxID=5936 RepID=A0AAD1XC20_EUPCR|nr:unnamed protein product [Moneuplotes crassus]